MGIPCNEVSFTTGSVLSYTFILQLQKKEKQILLLQLFRELNPGVALMYQEVANTKWGHFSQEVLKKLPKIKNRIGLPQLHNLLVLNK